VIIETALSGELLQTINVSADGALAPAGLAYAPASDGSGPMHFYIVDRGIDNNNDPNIVDGKMYEMSTPVRTLTTTTISSDLPDPSVVGQAVTINFSVALKSPGSGTPSGNVIVSDGTQSCTGTAPVGGCSIAFATPGVKTLRATYAGDVNFSSSSSKTTAAHTVNKANTTTTITSDLAASSVVGQAVTINYSVAVSSPGSGTPSGNVTVSDGTQSCTGSVAAGTCSITFTSIGTKNLSASYAGDTNFNGSASAPATAHTVIPANTTTVITSDLPDPSKVGQSVTINYNVAATTPGSGTPSGNVTVSDGTQSCTGSVAAGTCSITFTSIGTKMLTASFVGNANFNSSSSTPATAHTVNKADTTTTITSDLTASSVVGHAVTINYTVAVTSPGSGVPSGSVTVSDGTQNCTGSVADGSCSIVFSTSGAKILTATYAGDGNYTGSTSTPVPHSVIRYQIFLPLVVR
jgi:hypothetical protein